IEYVVILKNPGAQVPQPTLNELDTLAYILFGVSTYMLIPRSFPVMNLGDGPRLLRMRCTVAWNAFRVVGLKEYVSPMVNDWERMRLPACVVTRAFLGSQVAGLLYCARKYRA